MTGPAKIVSIGVVLIFAAVLGSTAAPPPRADGQQTFRYDTFGDEQLWTNVLRMHEALPAVDPATALLVGLKVDAEALPPELIAALRAGLDLTDPAVTIALLKLNAVVGVIGKFDDVGQLTSVGITCALCHSTVDNSLMTGIGRRLDGWPNRDLNVGAILGLSPLLDDPGWGPGRYDPRHQIFDGKNVVTRFEDMFPVMIPPAYGLGASDSRPTPAMARFPIGTATSACRRWAARATSAILASGFSSPRSRISSRRNCRLCANISSVSGRLLLRPAASMLPQRVVGNVCFRAKPTARDVTRRRRTRMC